MIQCNVAAAGGSEINRRMRRRDVKRDLVLAGEYHFNRIHIRSSQAGHLNPALATWSLSRRMRTALSVLERFDVERMITARFPIEQAAEAYALIDQSENPPLQVVLDYQ